MISFESFGLLTLAQTERIDDCQIFSLPLFAKLPTIKLADRFSCVSTPLITQDGCFSFDKLASFAGKEPIQDVKIEGDIPPAVAEAIVLTNAALACLKTDFRAFACKKFYTLLKNSAANPVSTDLLLAFLPCLAIISHYDLSQQDGRLVVSRIRGFRSVPDEDKRHALNQLDRMAGLAALILHHQAEILLPSQDTTYLESVQRKAWCQSTFGTAKYMKLAILEKSRSIYAGGVKHESKGILALYTAAHSLLGDCGKAMSGKHLQRPRPPVEEVNADVVEDEPRVIETRVERALKGRLDSNWIEKPDKNLIHVIDANALKADTGLRSKSKENWSVAKLDTLINGLETKKLDPAVFEQLAAEIPHAAKPLLDIARSLRLNENYGRDSLTIRPTLLVGEAGVGKSWVARRIADACGLPSLFLPLAGASDSMSILGTNRGWSTGSPSIARVLAEGFANPFIILDEIDKTGTSRHNGNAVQALLPLLEKSTAKVWFDQFFAAKIDCSMINIIATANSLVALPEPLLSRFQIYHLRPPAKTDFPKIIASVVREVAQEIGVHEAFLPALDGEEIAFLTASCRDIRTLSATVRRILEHRSCERQAVH